VPVNADSPLVGHLVQTRPWVGAATPTWLDQPPDRGAPRHRQVTAPVEPTGEVGGRHAADHRPPVAHRADTELAWRNYLAGQTAPEAGHTGGRLLLRILFAVTLVTSVALWWVDTPAAAMTDAATILESAGRICGLVGGYLLLAQVLLMSRVGWLERWVASHTLRIWHRELGSAVLVLILCHVALAIVAYAGEQRMPVIHAAWFMITTFTDMISALVATVLLVTTALLAIRAVRRRIRYELWYYLHLSAYLTVVLGYGHQFATGKELRHGFGRWYWAALYLVVLGCLVWGRIINPVVLNLRHRFRVIDVRSEGADMVSLYISGRRLPDLRVRAGQYFRWRFLTKGRWWQSHPFSLSAAPNGEWLRLTVKRVGDHTSELAYLRPGVRVLAEGPSGAFTADRRVKPRALLIAAGSGIAPIRALLEDLPHGTAVIYRASTRDEVVFREELDWLARERGATIWYVLGSRHDPWPRHVFSRRGLRELVPDIRRRDVYLCGPQGLAADSLRILRRMRMPRRQIHLDPFEF
jgi:predicted ferric reductase